MKPKEICKIYCDHDSYLDPCEQMADCDDLSKCKAVAEAAEAQVRAELYHTVSDHLAHAALRFGQGDTQAIQKFLEAVDIEALKAKYPVPVKPDTNFRDEIKGILLKYQDADKATYEICLAVDRRYGIPNAPEGNIQAPLDKIKLLESLGVPVDLFTTTREFHPNKRITLREWLKEQEAQK